MAQSTFGNDRQNYSAVRSRQLINILIARACVFLSALSDNYNRIQYIDGSDTCATGTPASSLPLGDIEGIGAISGPAKCSFYCGNLFGCVSFNYRSVPLADGTQCELFTMPARKCGKAVTNCRHYEVR